MSNPIFILYLILLPWCFGIKVDNTIPDNILHLKYVTINGQKTTLREIYGDSLLSAGNFKPGKKLMSLSSKEEVVISSALSDVSLSCAGGAYVERQFSFWSSSTDIDRLSQLPSTISDTPTVIATKISQDMMTQTPPAMMLVGDPQAGKSVALGKIQYELHKLMPNSWSILVDLLRLYSTAESFNEITLENIVKTYVEPDYLDLFYNLLEINAKKIVILFDGLEHMPGDRTSKILSVIQSVAEKGAIVVLTGRKNTLELLQDKLALDKCEVGEMDIHEAKKFLANIWQAKLRRETALKLRNSSPIDPQIIGTRLKDYVQSFTHTLFKTQLPRQPGLLMILAETFEQQSSSIFTPVRDVELLGCLDYVLSPSPVSPISLSGIKDIRVNKNTLYEKFVAAVTTRNGHLNNMDWAYGVVAITQIVRKYETPKKGKTLLRVVEKNLGSAEKTLKDKRDFAIFINFMQDQTIEFIHPEFQNFYAAKLIVASINNDNMPMNLLQNILRYSHYNGILEFFNYQVKSLRKQELSVHSGQHGALNFPIMDNIITHGYENLFDSIFFDFRWYIPTSQLRQYFLYRRRQFYLPKRIFGMMHSILPHPDPNPFDSLMPTYGIRFPLELLVEQGMFEACRTLISSPITYIDDEKLYIYYTQQLLLKAVSRPIPNLELVKFLMVHYSRYMPPNFLDNLLYHTIKLVGDRCIPVANYLVECGANPGQLTPESGTLLHVAVKWNSEKLLRHLVEQFNLPVLNTIDWFRRTIFMAALDANPSPSYIVPGWWEMMEYIVSFQGNLRFTDVPINRQEDFMIPKEDVDSPWFKLMLSNMDYVDTNSLNINAQTITIRSMDRIHGSHEQLSALTDFVPSTSWQLSPKTLALRRKFLLQNLRTQGSDTTSQLEMFIHFRGIAPLSSTERQHCTTIIKILFNSEKKSLTAQVRYRIIEALGDNIGDEYDYKLLSQLFRQGLPLTTSYYKVTEILSQIKQRISHIMSVTEQPNAALMLPLSDVLLQSRSSYNSVISNDKIILDGLERLQIQLGNGYYTGSSGSSDVSALNCLSRQTRRHIVFSTACYIVWEDVDPFNNAIERRIPTKIIVNSDHFLNTLAALEYSNREKAHQLVSLVRQLENNHAAASIITGKSQLAVRDMLQYGSFSEYQQNRCVTDIINDIWHPLSSPKLRSMFPLPSRTVALYAASSIPIIRGLHATISTCLQQYNGANDNSCLYATSALTLSVALPVVGTDAVKYTPWIVNQFSNVALEMLPSTAPHILYNHVKLMRHFGLKFGAKTIGMAFGIAGLGFDLYDIIVMSKMINQCSLQPADNACPNKDVVEYIISLTFACVSIVIVGGLLISGIGFVPGLLIGLGLMAMEEFAKGTNEVVHYSKMYDTDGGENFRIFWHKITFQQPPADVQALARRSLWMEHLQQHATQLLQSSTKHIVAYGIGIGHITDGGLIASASFINMEVVDSSNTRGLSRVIPEPKENTTLLCLPQQDTRQVYDKYVNNVTDAVYRCENAFVISLEERWKTRSSAESYIIYDLVYVESGTITGSNTLNNMFLIYNGTSSLNIFGGQGNITNIYVLRDDSFHGSIIFDNQSRNNILDLSSTKSPIMSFEWYFELHAGRVRLGNKSEHIYLITPNKLLPNIHVIGRTGKSDRFSCNYTNYYHRSVDELHTSIDGGGGLSLSNMDHVSDCKISILRPFTYIEGSNSSNVTYMTYVWLEFIALDSNTAGYATIQPKQSKFVVIFQNRPLLRSIYNLTYTLMNQTLTWHLQHTESSSLVLSIQLYRSLHSLSQQDTTFEDPKFDAVNCIFIDNYSGSTIFPVINALAEESSTITVRYFTVFATVNSSQLTDVFYRYQNMAMFQNEMLYIITKLTHFTTGQTFTFGSSANDRFYIDGNTTFLFGGNGRDVYALSRDFPNSVWIDNEANDYALDTLIIPDAICDFLRAEKSSSPFDCCDGSQYDVTLFCSVNSSTTSSHKTLILRNYLQEQRYRHLQIYWRDATYVLLPYDRIHEYRDNADTDTGNTQNPEITLLFSFGEQWHTTTLTLTSHDSYVVFNISEPMNALVAYRSQFNDIIISKKYINRNSSGVVVLQDFFSNDTDTITVSPEWKQFRIFIADITTEDNISRTLTVDDILDLFFNTHFDDATDMQANADLIEEYFVNVTDAGRNKTIDRNNSQGGDVDYRLGVLMVTGATPREFHAQWDRRDNMSLALCAPQTCIIIKNWCGSIHHRIHRMEFILNFYHRPIVIRNLDQFECQQQDNNSTDDKLIEQLNYKFLIAQKQLQLMDKISDDSDRARLMRCVGSVLVDNIAHEPMYRLFGFGSITDQATFIRDNCNVLFTQEYLNSLSWLSMYNMLQTTINIFKLNEITPGEQRSISLIRDSYREFGRCWPQLKSSLCNLHNATRVHGNIFNMNGKSQSESHLMLCKTLANKS